MPKANRKESLVILVNKELQKYKTKQGKYNGLVKLLSKPEFLVACYENIRGKPGNMTPGTDKYTLDGLSWNWFVELANSIRRGQFAFSPIRRVWIPKSKDKNRPLGVGSPRDKIVQKALSVILEHLWEPEFLNTSHGFRPNRSVHTALLELYLKGGNYTWVIQGDISKCFDSIPHDVILKIISEKIQCARTLELINKTLKIHILDSANNNLSRNIIGTPQGSVLSPILANIVLHKFDQYMSKYKMEYDTGKMRKVSQVYSKLSGVKRRATDQAIKRRLSRQMRRCFSLNMMDPEFRRLLYVRYADDFVICLIGPQSDAKKIRLDIKNFLKDKCGLDLNVDKTVISKISDGFNFLGAHITKANMLKNHVIKVEGRGKRRATTRLRVNLNLRGVLNKLVETKIAKWVNPDKLEARGTALNSMINHSHADIIAFFNSKINGILAFYSFAGNRKLLHYVIWILRESCGLTLAKKYKVRTLNKIYKKYGKEYTCPETGMELAIPETLGAIHDYKFRKYRPKDLSFLNISWAGKLTESNIGKACILCGTTYKVEMHHVRSIKDIRAKIRKGNASFAVWSGAYKRKQIPLCEYHHRLYHAGLLNYADIKVVANFTKSHKEDPI